MQLKVNRSLDFLRVNQQQNVIALGNNFLNPVEIIGLTIMDRKL